MIIELKKNELNIINNTFISKKYVENEFNANPFSRFFILKMNKEIIGYIYYSDIYERAEINQFEINFIHRNCGYGNILLKETIKILKKDISLEVNKENQIAIKLYEKNSFKVKAIRKG